MNIELHTKCLFLALTPLALSLTLLSTAPAKAQYSDRYDNQKQAEVSRDLALNYGVTDSHSAETYLNRRNGYLKGEGHSYYSTDIIPTTRVSFSKNLFDTKNYNLEAASFLKTEIKLDEVVSFLEPKTEDFLPQALAIIRKFEGFREQAYVDTDGTPVIGYGLSKVDGRKVQLGDTISVAKADAVLSKQLLELEEQIKSMVTVELNSKQLSALSSFAFNVGIYGLESSTLLKKLNVGDYAGAANEFTRWDKATIRGRKVTLAGLTRRREAEKQLFLK